MWQNYVIRNIPTLFRVPNNCRRHTTARFLARCLCWVMLGCLLFGWRAVAWVSWVGLGPLTTRQHTASVWLGVGVGLECGVRQHGFGRVRSTTRPPTQQYSAALFKAHTPTQYIVQYSKVFPPVFTTHTDRNRIELGG